MHHLPPCNRHQGRCIRSAMPNVTIVAALVAGMLSFLSPCVLPLVPPYLVYLDRHVAGTAGGCRSRAAGAARDHCRGDPVRARLLDGVRRARRQRQRHRRGAARLFGQLAIVAGVGIIIMGLHFLGLTPVAWLMREKRLDVAKPVGLWGAYLMGLAFAFGWTPCIGPILAAILAVAASRGDGRQRRRHAGDLFARSRRAVH